MFSVRKQMIGKRFGRLLVVGFSHIASNRHAYWNTRCVCGSSKIISGSHLRRGNTLSCGCNHFRKIHGKCRTPIHEVWQAMIQRCTNPNSHAWKYYGARGISVCDEWKNFKQFYKDMGEPPMGLTLERVNNNGNYELSNCKWATWEEQANNQRKRGNKR